MAIAAVLAVTLDPAVRLLFTRLDPFGFRRAWLRRIANAVLVGRIHGEETHPVSRPLTRLYHPVVDLVLRFRRTTIALAVLAVVATVPVFLRFGSEFMPPLNEGTILYMPTALPGMSTTQARAAIQTQDRALMRSDAEGLQRVLVAGADGVQVPLGQLADVTVSTAPPTIHDENGALAGFVFVDVAGRDLGGYVAEAKRAVAAHVPVPPGYHLGRAGQFEYLERARARLLLVVPATLLIVFVLLYLNTKSVTKTMIVLLAVPFSAVGAVWLLWLLGYDTSIAVWVGLVALLGVDADTGVFMLLYLDLAWSERVRHGRMRTAADLHDAIVEDAVQRLRAKVMTVGVMFMGLLPIMWSHGTGADVMKRIAAPMIGGILTSFLMELLVYPAIYALWRERGLPRAQGPAPVVSGTG